MNGMANTRPVDVKRPPPQRCRCGGWWTPDRDGRVEHEVVFGHRPVKDGET